MMERANVRFDCAVCLPAVSTNNDSPDGYELTEASEANGICFDKQLFINKTCQFDKAGGMIL